MSRPESSLVRALARFRAAEFFRAPSTRIPDGLAALVGHNTQAVSPTTIRDLLARGWLAHPAGGQYQTTEVGRQQIEAAIRARGGGQ